MKIPPHPVFCVCEAVHCPGVSDLELGTRYYAPAQIGQLKEDIAKYGHAVVLIDGTRQPGLSLRYLERLSAHEPHIHMALIIVLNANQQDILHSAQMAGATGFLIADLPRALRRSALDFIIQADVQLRSMPKMGLEWSWERQNGQLIFDEELSRKLGLPPRYRVETVEDLVKFVHRDDREHMLHLIRRCFVTKLGFSATCRVSGQDGRVYKVRQYVHVCRRFEDEIDGLSASVHLLSQDQGTPPLHERRTRDPLTAMPNHRGAQQWIERHLGHKQIVNVVTLSISKFERFNALMGREQADEILLSVAERLKAIQDIRIFEEYCWCRLGGAEYALLITGARDKSIMSAVAEAVLASIKRPLYLAGEEIYLTARIGITSSDTQTEDANALLQQSNVALNVAKDGEPNTYRFYSPVHFAGQSSDAIVEQALRGSIERDELEIYFQPFIDVATRHITGFEALMRWRHPEFGLMTPNSFLKIAENSGIVKDLSDWALAHSLKTAAKWPTNGKGAPSLSVNISAEQFRRTDLVAWLLSLIEGAQFDPARLILELTETVVMEDMNRSARLMHQIKAMGVRLAIDDFGTGYSSLGYLKHLPFCALKVDRIFVEDLPGSKQDLAMLDAIVSMAKTLNMSVIAEGVEEEAQLACLASHGCDMAQGFLFSSPLPSRKIQDFLEAPAA